MNAHVNEATARSVAATDRTSRNAAHDHRIVDAAYRAFRASGYGQLLGLSVYCDDGRVTLQGRLPTFYLKQVAQSVLRSIDGIRDIDNDIKVQSHH